MTKYCSKCDTEKPVADFGKWSHSIDGLQRMCKLCTNSYNRKDYNKNLEKIRAKRKIERTTDTFKEKHKVRYLRHRTVNPQKYKARYTLNNALRAGKIVRLPCEECGGKAQAHHDDYSKPLIVKWLCFKHHRILHGQVNV